MPVSGGMIIGQHEPYRKKVELSGVNLRGGGRGGANAPPG